MREVEIEMQNEINGLGERKQGNKWFLRRKRKEIRMCMNMTRERKTFLGYFDGMENVMTPGNMVGGYQYL